MSVERDAVYLIPPRKEMIISGGRLLLTDKDPTQGLALPIDLFFRSLANDLGPRGAAVVLSGTGSDGSRGIRDVHSAGGLVIAQSEDSAKFDGMPRSAIDTGVVDLVLPAEEIPGAILRHIHHPALDQPERLDERPASEEGMQAIFKLLRQEYGIDFSHYKPSTVLRRTDRRLSMMRSLDLADYVERLKRDSRELNSLYRDLLIGVTSFFRDGDAFEKLGREIGELLRSNRRDKGDFRVWIAGCATGEEAYTVAMLAHEQLIELGEPREIKIFATDVHRASLDFASAGIYSETALAGLSPARRERYFTQQGEGYQIAQELRQMIVFAPHNIIKDAPFTKLDLITCRNLLIYLQPLAQRKALSLFHFGLRTGGLLFLGPSESPAELSDEFEVVDEHWKIYRKRRDVRLPADLRLSLPTPGSVPHRPGNSPWTARPTHLPDAALLAAYDSLLAEFMPPSLLIGESRELVHTFGGAERFLQFKGSRPSTDVLDLIDPELRVTLAGAIQRAGKQRGPVVYRGVTISEGRQRVDLGVRPLPMKAGGGFSLVTLENSPRPDSRSPEAEPRAETELRVEEASRDRVDALETELRYAKENLQATIEELETSNEELQATNEELVASNEELQSTNEELHSVNEELYTVNAEYQRKIAELTELTNDMDNLLSSTEIGTIFLDRELRIRKFTPQIARAFDLLPTDIGRRIDTFSHNLELENFLADVAGVLASGVSLERETRDRLGNWYFLRLLPYRSKFEIEGVVLTLIDIGPVKRAECELREAVRRRDLFLAMLSHELRNPLGAILSASQVLERRLNENAVEEAGRVAGRQARQMARLLDDLLDISRITQNKLELRPARLDLRRPLEDAVESVRAGVQKLRQTLDVSLPAEPLWLVGDEVRLQQAFVNLLANASKYTPAGGHLELVVQRDLRTAVVRVRDDGVGIPAAMLENIFEMFVQADDTLDRASGGMGVGLTLARHIVQLHGGSLVAASEGPGQGSEFTLRLPIGQGTTEVVAPSPGSVPRALSLLLVEDNRDSREMLGTLLELEGHRVTTASNSEEALRLLVAERPDVALVDIGLPVIDGYELARRIRARPDCAGLTLVAVTGYGQPDDRKRALAAGFDEHVTKPVDQGALARVFAKLAGGARC